MTTFKPYFEIIQRPVGPQPLPSWLIGAHVNFMDGWGNIPHLTFKTNVDTYTHDWERVYTRIGAKYTAQHPDGRMHQLHHAGAVALREIGYGPHTRTARATEQDQGFGGSSFTLMMDDGQETVLRGPWCGGAPTGWNEAAFVNVKEDYYLNFLKRKASRPGPRWLQATASAAVWLSDDLIIKSLSRFCPHLELARTERFKGCVRIEPLKPEWDAPKNWKEN